MRSSVPKKPHNWQKPFVLCSVLLFANLMLSFFVRVDETAGQMEKTRVRHPAEQQMETAALTYFERVNAGDVEGILALFADDAQLISPLTGEEGIRGKEALRAYYQNLFSTFVDSHASPTDIIIEGNKLVAPLHFEAKTHDGTLIATNNLNLWTFEHGKFKVLVNYLDSYPYRLALGQLPGSGNQ